jgi:hypothetical protein
MEWKKSLTREQWDKVTVLILGPHMPRKRYVSDLKLARHFEFLISD